MVFVEVGDELRSEQPPESPILGDFEILERLGSEVPQNGGFRGASAKIYAGSALWFYFLICVFSFLPGDRFFDEHSRQATVGTCADELGVGVRSAVDPN
jgi:hypothetical protein